MIQRLVLSKAAEQFGGTLMSPDCCFDGVATDSRQVAEGQLFVALKGERFDGHEFLPDVIDRACGVVVDHPVKEISIPQWVVPDTTEALGQLALMNRQLFAGPVVAVTGSSGKTTVKEMIAAILRESGEVLATQGNLNNQIGVPKTLFELGDRHAYAVVEMGASGPGEIAYLCGIAKPDVVVVNNVMPAHVAGFGSLEGIASAKGEIYRDVAESGTAVINIDEPYAEQWRQSTVAQVLTFSTVDPHADFHGKNVVTDDFGCCGFTLISPVGEVSVSLALSGEHNVANALAAAACAFAAGADLEMIAVGLQQLQSVSGRMARQHLPNGTLVIDDSYNANPGSVKAAINALISISGHRVLVLGDMGELGNQEAELHAEIGRYAAEAGVNQLFAVGPLSEHTVKAFGEGATHFDSKQLLGEVLCKSIGPNTVILVKGSRFMAMEQVVQQLTESGER